MSSYMRRKPLSFPVFISRGNSLPEATSFYRKLKTELQPSDVGLIRLYRDVRKPSPGILFATKGTSEQDNLFSVLVKYAADNFKDDPLEVRKFGATDDLQLIARGVPMGLNVNSIYNSNLGLVVADSVQRLSRNVDGKELPMDSVLLKAPNKTAAQSLIENGLKIEQLLVTDVSIKIKAPLVCFVCGILGHTVARCPDLGKYGLFQDEKGRYPLFCFKCKQTGHKYTSCFSGTQPQCPNCPEHKNAHWPFDSACPARSRKLNNKAASVHSNWAKIVIDSNLQKTKTLESRLQKIEAASAEHAKHYETQKQALHDTRMVVRDISLVLTKKKKNLSTQTTSRITDWYEWEKICNSRRSTPNKNLRRSKRSRATPPTPSTPPSSADDSDTSGQMDDSS